ncbi:MAG: glycine--tRNA ligase subunit beta, partial [Candidatus Margulisbacteria bacterium]|nr:glycine--tRNA ligase subunit beta [Candidatus Margulisiibacteriota bacterium]
KLKHIVYQESLGTLYVKVERIKHIVGHLTALAGCGDCRQKALRVAELAKCDLVSHMVYEFPSLQGVMGEKYAQMQGEDVVVCQGIFEHYLPRFAGDKLPKNKEGAIVAISDKLESICGCFAAGLKPTSSQDPYALRRAAQGIVLIILDQGFDISLSELINYGLGLHKAESLKDEIVQFFKGRLKFVLQENQVRYDLIDAVLAVPQEDILTTVQLGLELQKVAKRKDFNKFVDTGVRVYRLSKDAKDTNIQDQFFAEDIEREIYILIQSSEALIEDSLNHKKYKEVVEDLYKLAEPVDKFFVKVLVMDEDQNKRNNRLAILKRLDKLFKRVGDFEKIVTS